MQKKTMTYILVLIWMVIAVQMVVNTTLKPKDKIVEAFHVISSIPVESNVEVYGHFGDMELSVENKEQMLKNMAKQLGITEGYELYSQEGDAYEKSCLLLDGVNARTDMQVISMDTTDVDGNAITSQYIYITITLYNDVENVLTGRDLLVDMFESIGVEAHTNIYLEGELEGQLSSLKKEWLVQEFLKAMEAKEVSGNRDQYLYTIYGYTQNERQCVYQNGEKVNVNIAITYDEENDKTLIHMAVPFINKSL